VQAQFGGQHRASRPAPGDDHVEHEGRAIGAGGRRSESGDVAHGEVALDHIVRRRLGVNCRECMGVAFRECLVGEALPATPTSIARP
jgi:hypothetical protein